MEEQAQLSVWPQSYRKYNLFVINQRWGIRDSAIYNNPAVIIHRCSDGETTNIHDIGRYSNYKCHVCNTPIPSEIQAVWHLRTWDDV